jgi:hypothetical protein
MYPWIVTLHLIGVGFFLISHGISMAVAFRVREERDRAVIVSLLGISLMATRATYVGLLLLGVGGLWAAATTGILTATWVVASYVVLAIALVVMWIVASPYYMGIRQGLRGSDKAPRLSDEDLVARLQSRRPDILAAVGATALVVLIALMAVKPA